MKRILAITIASASLAGVSSVHAALNLVSDSNFSGSETGALTGSTTPWFDPTSTTVINSSKPLSGSTQNAVVTTSGYLDQSLVGAGLTAGTGYTIDLWLATANAGTLTVRLGAASTTLSIPSSGGYVEYNFDLTTINTASLTLQWGGSTPLDVGQVSVAVPEPTTMVAGALMLLPFAASTLRLRKKASA